MMLMPHYFHRQFFCYLVRRWQLYWDFDEEIQLSRQSVFITTDCWGISFSTRDWLVLQTKDANEENTGNLVTFLSLNFFPEQTRKSINPKWIIGSIVVSHESFSFSLLFHFFLISSFSHSQVFSSTLHQHHDLLCQQCNCWLKLQLTSESP